VKEAVGSEELFEFEVERGAVEVCGFAAGFLKYQNSCCDVPRFEVKFPESVEKSAGCVAEIDRCRAGASHAE